MANRAALIPPTPVQTNRLVLLGRADRFASTIRRGLIPARNVPLEVRDFAALDLISEIRVFCVYTHEARRPHRVLNSPLAWRMLDASESRAGGVRGGCRRAG